MKKNVLSVVLASIIFATLCVNSFAVPSLVQTAAVSAEEKVVSRDVVAAVASETALQLPKGEGTAESPYEIYDADDFFTVKAMVEGNNSLYADKVYEIKSCIDFNGKAFSPIGTSGAPFKGTVIGNGHKLFNVTVCDTAYIGVIGYMEKGSISDLHVEYVNGTYELTKAYFFGGLVGKLSVETSTENVNVTGCSTKGDIIINTALNMEIGGVFGNAEAKKGDFYVNNCASYMNLTVNTTISGNVGGFAGKLSAQSNKFFEVSNCVAYGNVSLLSTASGGYCGGFSGFISCDESDWSNWVDLLEESYYVKNCIAYGDVEITSNSGCVGGFGAHKGEFLKYKGCVVPITQSVSGDQKVVYNSAKSLSALQKESTLSQTYKFDFTNTWKLDGNKKLVLTNECASCKTFSVSKDCVILTGFEGEYDLTISTYSGGVMTGIKFVPVTQSGKISLSETGIDTEGADTVKAFLFEKDSFFKPVCQAAFSKLS